MQKIPQSLPDVALTIKREFEIYKTVFAIKSFFSKHFKNEICFDIDLRDYSNSAVSVSLEQLALIFRFLLDRRRSEKRISISVVEDEFELSFSVELEDIEPLTPDDEKKLSKLAQVAGFSLCTERALTFKSKTIFPMQYLVFVRSKMLVKSIFELTFWDIIH